MARTLALGAVFAALPAGLLFSGEVSARIDAANILHIDGGEIGTVVAGAELSGKAGFSVTALRAESTVDALRFSAEAVSASVHFPVQNVRVSANISAAALHDITVCDTASFESAGVVVAGGSARIPLFGDLASLSPFCAAGRLDAAGGFMYGFRAVPKLSPFFLFGTAASFPALTVLVQGGLTDISVRSEAESDIDSSGFQRQFLLLCGNKVRLPGVSLLWWGGALYTDGEARAQTEYKDAAIRTENQFFALGTGAQFSSEGRRFFWSAGLHVLYLPLGYATAEFNCDIKFIFTGIRKQFDYTFDSRGEFGLLLPRVSGGVRFRKNGRIFIDKTFSVPLRFSAPSSSASGAPSGSTDTAHLLLTALLSGLSIGIRL